MLNSESDKTNFELWLSTGLKKPIAAGESFTERLLGRLDDQEKRRLLGRICLAKRIYMGIISVLILSAVGLMFYPPASAGIFTFLRTLLAGLVRLILEPTLMGILVPAAVVLTVAVVVWNLLDMVSLE
jgi:hypothetical protein